MRVEHKLNVLRQENDLRKDQLKQMKIGLSKLESKFDVENKHRKKQLSRVLVELEQLNRHMNEIRTQMQSASQPKE